MLLCPPISRYAFATLLRFAAELPPLRALRCCRALRGRAMRHSARAALRRLPLLLQLFALPPFIRCRCCRLRY